MYGHVRSGIVVVTKLHIDLREKINKQNKQLQK